MFNSNIYLRQCAIVLPALQSCVIRIYWGSCVCVPLAFEETTSTSDEPGLKILNLFTMTLENHLRNCCCWVLALVGTFAPPSQSQGKAEFRGVCGFRFRLLQCIWP